MPQAKFMEKCWKSYEEVATYLLNQMASKFGLKRVEGKQTLTGVSGTNWEIDAKGVKTNSDEAFVIIECRRYTKEKVKQEPVGGLAYRILDTRAKGGIIVTPLGLQAGAEKIASAENIISVILTENSTPENYMLKFLNNVFIGLTEHVHVSDNVQVTIVKNITDEGRGIDKVDVQRK